MTSELIDDATTREVQSKGMPSCATSPNRGYWFTTSIMLILGIAGGAVVFVLTARDGLGICTDSVEYISTAEHLADGRGFVNYSLEPTLLWPPLFPLLLAGFELLDVPSVDAARFINIAIVGTLIVATSFFVSRKTSAAWLGILAGVLVLLSGTVLGTCMLVWSDSLFLLLTTLSLMAMTTLDKRPTFANIALCSVLVCSACLARYIGVTLIFTGVLYLSLNRCLPVFARLTRVLWFGSIASLPTVIWLIRNWFVSGTLSGPRYPTPDTLEKLAGNVGIFIANWALPWRVINLVSPLFWFTILAAVLAIGGTVVLGRYVAGPPQRTAPTVPMMTFVCIYLGFLILSSSRTVVDVKPRMIAPVYVPILISLLLALSSSLHLWRTTAKPRRRWLPLLLAAPSGLVAFWLIGGTVKYAELVTRLYRDGPETEFSCDSELLAYAQHRAFDKPILSNTPYRLWFCTRRITKPSPRKCPWRSPADIGRLERERLNSFLHSHGPVSLLWFEPRSCEDVYTPQELTQWFDVHLVAQCSDGAVYEIALADAAGNRAP